MSARQFSLLDTLVGHADQVLRTLAKQSQAAQRSNPAHTLADSPLNAEEQRHVAGLMRINHTGEVCAQALYHGQALTAKLPTTRADMEHAAAEEIDHLVWCEQRLNELGAQPSILNPLFYGASFAIGALAGAAGDKWSLGFVAATEEQVCEHLQSHLNKLPLNDKRTQAILQQMQQDEASHRQMALDAGAAELPQPVQQVMRLVSKVMTESTYRI